MISSDVAAQQRPYTKVYLGSSFVDLLITLNLTTPLAISYKPRRSGYALIEIDLDSLGLTLDNERVVFLHIEPDKAYYYGIKMVVTEMYQRMLPG
jgi:hypothetical protein